MNAVEVTITEVGPRDGLQNTKSFMPTAAKKAWISAEAAAGVHEIEVCSFVPAKLIPQFIDAEEVLAHANAVPGLTAVVLVPNLKGCERALAAGARRITVPISVSEAHSMSNVRKTTAQAIEDFARMADLVRSQAKAKSAAGRRLLDRLRLLACRAWWRKTTCCGSHWHCARPEPMPSAWPTPSATPTRSR